MDNMFEQIEVLDKFENVIAVFSKYDENDEDKMINPIVSLLQNGDCTFSFQISVNSKKWKEIQFVENLYRVNGRVFSPKFDDGYIENLDENNQNLITVNCYERQKSDLGTKYVTVWNSETGIIIDNFMVVILSGGDLPLKNNGIEVKTHHIKGTAGYILEGLLFDTGWIVGTVDVEGTYDFETEQLYIYDNILKVQELFGGILVFDSLNKIIHLRDETKYLQYSGYEVKYKKNMISAEKNFNNDIITRVTPLGQEGLNIKSVNNNVMYLENFEYSGIVTERIITNEDIYEPEQLKKWGERKLQELCRPRKRLTVSLTDLRKSKGYELQVFDLNSIVDVIDYNGFESREQLRVISWQYNVFAIYEATIELGDMTLNTLDIFKKISNATNEINNGLISSTKIINYKTGNSIAHDYNYFNTEVTTFMRTQTETNEGIVETFERHNDEINGLTGDVLNLSTDLSTLSKKVDSISASVNTIGGNNKQRNSVGAYGTSEYEQNSTGYIIATEEERLKNITDNGFGRIIYISAGKQFQFKSDNLVIGEYYTLSFKYASDPNNVCKIELINNTTTTLVDITNGIELTTVKHTFIANSGVVYLRVTCGDRSIGITDYYLQTGSIASKWQPAAGEILGTAVSIYYNGIKVTSANSDILTNISNLGFTVQNIDGKILITFNKDYCILSDTRVNGVLEQGNDEYGYWKTYTQVINGKEIKLEVQI